MIVKKEEASSNNIYSTYTEIPSDLYIIKEDLETQTRYKHYAEKMCITVGMNCDDYRLLSRCHGLRVSDKMSGRKQNVDGIEPRLELRSFTELMR